MYTHTHTHTDTCHKVDAFVCVSVQTVTADYEASAPSDSPIETRQGDVALNVFPLWGSVNGFPLLLPSWASISQVREREGRLTNARNAMCLRTHGLR